MSGGETFLTAFIAGGIAGFALDVVPYPIDTIKTRLQSKTGFYRSGGFKNIFKGLGPVAAGSIPGSAIFFCSYESIKYHMGKTYPNYKNSTYVNMFAATIGGILACIVRVPVEIVKQRHQVDTKNTSSIEILWNTYKTHGFRKGLYRGYEAMLFREIPFSFIQFPLWEYFEFNWCNVTGFDELTPISASICGAVAGGIAAALTTPLDVAKTRIMLSEHDISVFGKKRVRKVLIGIYRERGIKGLFAGIIARVIWITLGSSIYFGVYDLSERFLAGKI